jgi:hypothetical protein
MESEEPESRFGQFTLAGAIGYMTLIALSLAAIRQGMVAEWVTLIVLGVLSLGAAVGFGVATVIWPRRRRVCAIVGAIALPLIVLAVFMIHVHHTHNAIKTDLVPLQQANPIQQTPLSSANTG